MAAEDRQDTSEIVEKLLTGSSNFSFVQAVRLLLREMVDDNQIDGDGIDRNLLLDSRIRIRPELSLRFPGTDITGVEKIGQDPGQFLITATFLGLYGSSSPLPTFYTEDLIQENNDGLSIRRDFIDIINYTIYPLFFKVWSKYRLVYKICEEKDESIAHMLYCLLGLETESLRQQIPNLQKYFRYTGLALQFPRSAEGLESIIEDRFNLNGHVKINQCVLRSVSIPNDQHSLLGVSCCTLGNNAVIGKQIDDISGKFQLVIFGADGDMLNAFLPDKELFGEIKQVINFYVHQPLEWELVIECEEKMVETVQLDNARWSHLGWDTWLFSENKTIDKVQTRFSA
ncbi:MAG: type VI secretion system baseplate subunit TssG [Desulfobacteraceae bacterium]|nr:type VI secretion system baseplate subunit TssG [Desulfobacteraceae bacterium]